MLSQSCIVLFDVPPARLVINAVTSSKLVMQLKGKLGCEPAECLIDSGAGLNGISQQFAEKHGLSVNKLADAQVSMPDGESSPVIGLAKCVSESKHTSVRSCSM